MSDIKLGEVITGAEARDAVHVAVAPVVAAEQLHAGQRVGFVDGGVELVGPTEDPIGIVDPFLTGYVAKGERFWMCLFPQTVTVVRHNWTHPAFTADASDQMQARNIDVARAYLARVAKEFYAAKSADELVGKLSQWIADGYPQDEEEQPLSCNSHGELPDWFNEFEMWQHFETITGKTPDRRHVRECISFCC